MTQVTRFATLGVMVMGLALSPLTLSAQTAQTAPPQTPPAAAPQQPPVFQPSKNPVSDALRDTLARSGKNLVAAAELLPPEKYEFRPTPPQMTFGALIAHIVETNVMLCAGISGGTPPDMPKLTAADKKDTLVAGIKQSFDYCTKALADVSDAQLGEEVKLMGRATGISRGKATLVLASDWADHYSTAAAYLRLNDILPPTAKK